MLNAPFQIGETIKLKSGNSPQQVIDIHYFTCCDRHTMPPMLWRRAAGRPMKGWYVKAQYVSGIKCGYEPTRRWRPADHYEPHWASQFKPEEPAMTPNQLYMTKEEKPRFGIFLTRTSQGKIALEMKGSNEVETFLTSEIEEVMPHTVLMQRYNGGQNDGENRHYQFAAGEVQVGDVLLHLSTGGLWKVREVDTKNKGARSSKNGFFKLQGSFVKTET